MKVAVTGATGFIGGAIVRRLVKNTHDVVAIVRETNRYLSDDVSLINAGDIDSKTIWMNKLSGIDVIVHSAARVHLLSDSVNDPLKEYREINTYGTLNLARSAEKQGVKRFIFISTIKVNGESTLHGNAFTSLDPHNAEDPYGCSKSEAEEQLIELAKNSTMEIVIIRPPLVYGAGVKANFASLMNLVSKGFPLPFGAIRSNKRSLVSLENLVDLIVTCLDHPKARNQVFLVSDDHDLSTAALIQYMAKGLGSSGRMLFVPVWCYHLLGKLFRKEDVINRLVGSLQVDISRTKKILGWKPPQSLEDAFKETAQAFLCEKERNK